MTNKEYLQSLTDQQLISVKNYFSTEESPNRLSSKSVDGYDC
jgi:hypothetical protein